MIYRVGSIDKELNYGSNRQRNHFSVLLGIGVFEGMLSFSIFFILQTLKRSVLSDQAAYFVQESYHTTLLLFILISNVVMAFYNLARFKAVSFAEVYANIWYAPLHLGYSVRRLVYSKIFVQLASQYVITLSGFLTTLAISTVMKFPFISDYILSMLFIALLNTTTLLLIAMACSLVFPDISNARTMTGLLALALMPVRSFTGFFALMADRTRLADFSNFFTQNIYVYIALAIILGALFICIYMGSLEGRRYHPSFAEDSGPPELPEGASLVVSTGSKEKFMRDACRDLARVYKPRKVNGLLSFFVMTLLAAVVTFMLLVDAMLLAFSYASPERGTAILGFVPYVFQSSTMEPTIKYNDITFFERVDQYVGIETGDIVLYKDSVFAVQVRRVFDVYPDPATGETMLEVDIDYYPEGSAQGLLHGNVPKSSVYGRYVGGNRWLGVIVLFANTILGRILFMLVPTVLIFFNSRISDALKKKERVAAAISGGA
ncbi:MAG TPA: hypothetical protein PKW41_12100 [Clostridia bacterium]|nr:hypothetical protein [Clostridia bacterium]HPK16732.1 hypothetical protein [Clostridia bacterium]